MTIDPRHRTVNDESNSSALAAARKVNVLLAPLLVERFGDVQPAQPNEPERVIASYAVEDFGFHCRIGLALHNDAAASFTAAVCVGRFYRGYRRALRWLANNRVNNTVAIAFDDDVAKRKELWVACNRITTPADSAGLREALNDLHDELEAVDAGLRMWFPQVLRGQVLTDLEEAAASDAGLRAMLESPQAFLNMEHEDLADQLAVQFIEDAHGWLGRWDEQLRHVDRAASETDPDKAQLLWARARPLLEMERWDELLTLCRELEGLADEKDKPMLTGVLAHALYEKGDFEEVLDVLRSATLDNTARVWLYRALAQAKLGCGCEAMEAFLEYERIVGRDSIATEMLAAVMPDSDGF